MRCRPSGRTQQSLPSIHIGMRRRHSIILSAVLLSASCAAEGTQYEGKPPGWRPDKPRETTHHIVNRMLSKLKRFGNYKSGGWFYKYHTSQLAMEKSHEYLRPATLKSGGDTTRIDDEGKAILRAAEDALLWQSEQADLLSVAPDDDIAQWPLEEVSQLLRTADLVDADEFDELTAKMLRSLARDFVAVLRVFEYTFANMPDDEEAVQISRADNRAAGFPPPSQAPPVPGAPPPPAADESAERADDEEVLEQLDDDDKFDPAAAAEHFRGAQKRFATWTAEDAKAFGEKADAQRRTRQKGLERAQREGLLGRHEEL